jgi:hypothetical protein
MFHSAKVLQKIRTIKSFGVKYMLKLIILIYNKYIKYFKIVF